MKLALSAAVLALVTPMLLGATPSDAQSYDGRTWGQPYYGAYARPSPLSEAEPETHARLGAAGGGYTWGSGPLVDQTHGYGGHRGYGHGRSYGHGYGQGYRYGRYDRPSQPGYRDEWGYNDDRPPSRWRPGSTRSSRDYAYRACNCPDVYLYDR